MITAATNEEFAAFTDPKNFAGQLVLIHFILIEFAIGELAMSEEVGERFGFRRRASLAWLNGLLVSLPEEYHIHAEWALKYAKYMVVKLTSPYRLRNIHPDMSTVFEQYTNRSAHHPSRQIEQSNVQAS